MAQRWKRFETDTSESRLRRELEDLEEKVCWLSYCPFAPRKPAFKDKRTTFTSSAVSRITDALKVQ